MDQMHNGWTRQNHDALHGALLLGNLSNCSASLCAKCCVVKIDMMQRVSVRTKAHDVAYNDQLL